MKERLKIVPAVLFVLENAQGEMLLHLRRNTGFADGYWSVPGGHFEPEEHILQVVRREAEEELGIVVEEAHIHFLGMHHMRRKDGHDGINFYFKITNWQGQPSNTDPEHCAGMQWFHPHNLPENTFPEFFEIVGAKGPHMCIEGHFQPRLGPQAAQQKA